MQHFVHTSMQGERWDLLAYAYYGDANKQNVIIQANRLLFLDPLTVPPMVLPSGLQLIIPIVDDDELDESGLPPWKRSNPSYEVNS